MLPLFHFAASVPIDTVSARCVNNQTLQTEPKLNRHGLIVRLQMHTADDHLKGMHLCQSEYQLEIVHAEGRTDESGWDNDTDAEWDREIGMRLEGFSADGSLVIAVAQEGGSEPSLSVLSYLLSSGRYKWLSPETSFLRQLPVACRTAVRVEGLTPQGEPVLATTGVGCPRSRWRILQQKDIKGFNRYAPLPAGMPVQSLNPGDREHAPSR